MADAHVVEEALQRLGDTQDVIHVLTVQGGVEQLDAADVGGAVVLGGEVCRRVVLLVAAAHILGVDAPDRRDAQQRREEIGRHAVLLAASGVHHAR